MLLLLWDVIAVSISSYIDNIDHCSQQTLPLFQRRVSKIVKDKVWMINYIPRIYVKAIIYTCPRLDLNIIRGNWEHNNDVIMGTTAFQITSLTIVYSTVYLGGDQRQYKSFASQAFVRGIHRWPVDSPHKWPVTRKMIPFDDVIMRRAGTTKVSYSLVQ